MRGAGPTLHSNRLLKTLMIRILWTILTRLNHKHNLKLHTLNPKPHAEPEENGTGTEPEHRNRISGFVSLNPKPYASSALRPGPTAAEKRLRQLAELLDRRLDALGFKDWFRSLGFKGLRGSGLRVSGLGFKDLWV